MKKFRIAICGKMGAGKSYLAKQLAKKYNLDIYSFGEKLKEIARELCGMTTKDRKLLQTLADKMKEIDYDIWAKYLLRKIGNSQHVVIDDLRFENEYKLLKENGFIIIRLGMSKELQLERLKQTYGENSEQHIKCRNHNSESDKTLNSFEVDYDFQSRDDNQNFETLVKKFG